MKRQFSSHLQNLLQDSYSKIVQIKVPRSVHSIFISKNVVFRKFLLMYLESLKQLLFDNLTVNWSQFNRFELVQPIAINWPP